MPTRGRSYFQAEIRNIILKRAAEMGVGQESSEGTPSTQDPPFSPLLPNLDDPETARGWKGNDDSAICVSSKQLVMTPPMPQESQDHSCDTDFELSIAPDDKQATAKVHRGFHSWEPNFEGFLLDPESHFNIDEGEEDELNLADRSRYEDDTVPRWDYR
jgi:hypothetical protein